jgi:hypothetical protein
MKPKTEATRINGHQMKIVRVLAVREGRTVLSQLTTLLDSALALVADREYTDKKARK